MNALQPYDGVDTGARERFASFYNELPVGTVFEFRRRRSQFKPVASIVLVRSVFSGPTVYGQPGGFGGDAIMHPISEWRWHLFRDVSWRVLVPGRWSW